MSPAVPYASRWDQDDTYIPSSRYHEGATALCFLCGWAAVTNQRQAQLNQIYGESYRVLLLV